MHSPIDAYFRVSIRGGMETSSVEIRVAFIVLCSLHERSGKRRRPDQAAHGCDAAAAAEDAPQSRAELAEAVRRAKGKPTRSRAKRASAGKRGGAASPS